MKPIIIVDSASDLGQIEGRDIPSLPLRVLLGEREGLDGVDILPEDIYKYFDKTKKTPKTAAVEPARFQELFEKLTAEGREVIYISVASTMSGCYNNARIAAEGMEGVYVVESRWLSGGAALLALYADDLAEQGMSAPEIVKKVEARRDDVKLSLILDTMTFLYKGGRCKAVQALVAGVLKIKPAIIMQDEKLFVGKKYIGPANRSFMKYAADMLKNAKIDPKYFFLVHTSPSPELLEKVKEQIRGVCPEVNIVDRVASATVTSHCGKGGFALIYLQPQKSE